MTTPVPSDQTPTPAPAEQPAVVPGNEHRFQKFWENNARNIYLISAIVLVAILGRGAYDYFNESRDRKVGDEYAAASTSDKLKAFAASHEGHPLAGAARLRLADEAYQAGNYTQAAADYQTAADALKGNALAGRARLGLAASKMRAGQTADAEAQLNLIANDAGLLKTVRAEAAYQLASAAAAAGRSEDAHKFLNQVGTIEPTGSWAQRAMMLRMTLPVPAAPAGAPAVSIPAKP